MYRISRFTTLRMHVCAHIISKWCFSFCNFVEWTLIVFHFFQTFFRNRTWSHPWLCELSFHRIPHWGRLGEKPRNDPKLVSGEESRPLQTSCGYLWLRSHRLPCGIRSVSVWEARCGHLWWGLGRVVHARTAWRHHLREDGEEPLKHSLLLTEKH